MTRKEMRAIAKATIPTLAPGYRATFTLPKTPVARNLAQKVVGEVAYGAFGAGRYRICTTGDAVAVTHLKDAAS